MSSEQALAVISALAELPIYLKKFIDTVYALAVAFIQLFNILEGSGLKKAASKAISKRLKSLHSSSGTGISVLPFSAHADAHTSSLPGNTAIIYADYAGAPPYSISAVKAATEELLNGVWGNPHSDHGWDSIFNNITGAATTTTATSSSAAADRIRQLTLEMCHADPSEYVCILTSGATAALKLVAEAFPWSNGIEKKRKQKFGTGADSTGGNSNCSGGSRFLYLSDNHNSVLGIREVAAFHGAFTECIKPADIKIHSIHSSSSEIERARPAEEEEKDEVQHLFAFPLESNFSGTRYSENLVLAIQNQTLEISSSSTADGDVHGDGKNKPRQGRWRVLLDAAKACATHPPDLSQYPADFVALSYYKIFGYPTGLGALIVRRDALCMLRKTYFGGGTVLSSSAEDRFYALRPGYAGFEDGTLPFLLFPAVLHSFSAWSHRGGFPAVEKAANAAASQFAKKLLTMKHSNGTPVATIYGQWNDTHTPHSLANQANNDDFEYKNKNENNVISGQGPTVTFNLLDSNKKWVGHRQVQRIASLKGIYLRTGVMCNPGACSIATGVKAVQVKTWFENGHVCWDEQDVLDGVPTGAVRVSFGWGSTVADADALVEFVKRHFVSTVEKQNEGKKEKTMRRPVVVAERIENNIQINKKDRKHDDLRIHSLTIYPIKSAAGFSPRSWPVNPTSGLLYDRHWAVVDASGAILTLKKCPQLSRLHPVVSLEEKVMRIHAKGMKNDLEIPLPDHQNKDDACSANTSLPSSSATFINNWLTEAIGIPCSLIEYGNTNHYRDHSTNNSVVNEIKERKNQHGSFSNEAQILLVTVASLQALYRKSDIESSFEKFAARFRPNIIVEEIYLPSSLCIEEQEEEQEGVNFGGVGDIKKKEGIIEEVFVHKEDEMLAFEEEQWTSISLHRGRGLNARSSSSNGALGAIGDDVINCDIVGSCPRCEMICIDPVSGIRQGPEPLLTLAQERKGAGKKRFCFGVLLNVKEQTSGVGNGLERKNMSRVAVGMHVNYETHSCVDNKKLINSLC